MEQIFFLAQTLESYRHLVRKGTYQLRLETVNFYICFLQIILEVFNEWGAVLKHQDEIEEQNKIDQQERIRLR